MSVRNNIGLKSTPELGPFLFPSYANSFASDAPRSEHRIIYVDF